MKRTARAIARVVLWAWLGGCGGGTLGGNGGMIGTLTGAAGVTSPGSGVGGVASGTGGFAGFGGDIVRPPPGGAGGGMAGRGRGGTVGMGGRSGMSGTCPPPEPPVCGSLCGNGKIDSCERLATGPCPTQTWREECDGADFGSDSCTAYGYGSGTLICSSGCTVDPSACSYCVPSASVFSCGPSGIPIGPQRSLAAMALAATDTEVAVATVTYGQIDGSASVSLVRLSSALALQHNLLLDDNSQAGALFQAGIFGTAVAPIPSGWVVAVCGDPEIYIHAVDATTGVDIARTVVSSVTYPSELCVNGKPVLATRPGGGPLMLWHNQDGLTMSMIGSDGLSASPPQTIVGAPLAIGWEAIGAAWVGDEFEVVVPIDVTGTGGERALRILRVLPDGTPRFVGDFWLGQVDGAVRVATDASEVRIVYDGEIFGSNPGILWWRRAADGFSPNPVMIGTLPFSYGDAPAVAFGDDTLVLTGNLYGTALGITRIAIDGTIATTPYDIVQAPYGMAAVYEMVRRGPEAVVAWHTPDQIYLARIKP